MPYTKEHKQRTRERIVKSAARLFATHGFARSSIEEIMAQSQLTRGAFYAHFRSKADLYREAMETSASACTPPGNVGVEWLRDLLAASAMNGPWSFLANDIASGASEVRAAYALRVKALCRNVEEKLDASQRAEDVALAAVATFVGMLAIRATIDDASLRGALVTACCAQLLSLQQGVQKKEPESFFWYPNPESRATPLH